MHAAVGIERQAIGRGDLDDPRLQAPAQRRIVDGRARCSRRRSGLRTARNAGTPCRCRAAGRSRAGNADRLALPADLAGIGMQHAIDDLDQRALAGAVLAEQRMDLAGQDLEIDAVVGEAAREVLDDALERQKRNGGGADSLTLKPPCRSVPGAPRLPSCFPLSLSRRFCHRVIRNLIRLIHPFPEHALPLRRRQMDEGQAAAQDRLGELAIDGIVVEADGGRIALVLA